MQPSDTPSLTTEPLPMALGDGDGHEEPGVDPAVTSGGGTAGFLRGGVLARRLTVEMGPLAAFFLAFYLYDIYIATAVFMAATAVAAFASMQAENRVPVLPLLSLALLFLFGGLTLYLEDPRFIKMRPTALNLFYGLALAGSWVARAPLLRNILSPGLRLTGEGWRKLTLRLAVFLIALAVLNEVVWRNFDTDVWVAFKTFATVPLNLVFIALQVRLVRAHALGG